MRTIREEGLTKAQAAVRATKDLGFQVTLSNVVNAARGINLEWPFYVGARRETTTKAREALIARGSAQALTDEQLGLLLKSMGEMTAAIVLLTETISAGVRRAAQSREPSTLTRTPEGGVYS